MTLQFSQDPAWQLARDQTARIRDRLNRLYEIVGRYRNSFSTPGQAAVFAAILRAYHGLRPASPAAEERNPSETRSAGIAVTPGQRQDWIQKFISENPPSRALVNLRILFSEITQVRGRPVVGNFYRALSSGTLYEDLRSVRAYYDLETGEIVAFDDGTASAGRQIQERVQEGRRLQAIALWVDAVRSGRILDVTGIPEQEDESIRLGLEWLRGLQVLPESSG